MTAAAYNDAELMAVLMAREVRDGEISACGALSQIPAAALLLAKELHAPNAEIIILNTVFRPFHTSRQFHYLAQRGELGLFFVSGVQIDRYGNYNLHQLGRDPDHPEVRFPGGYGGGLIYYAARRSVIFRTEHTRRSLVDRVDYVSAAGSSAPNVLRWGNPSKLVTPKALFGFDRAEGVLRLESVHSPYTLEDIRHDTGFDLGMSGPIPATRPPSAAELHTLREVIRPKMIETGTYAAWAEKSLGARPSLGA
ncbi:MAG: CoA synthetase [Burkholderiales bacterium]|nr:CoA synthetase [Burkholderiales bacterium]